MFLFIIIMLTKTILTDFTNNIATINLLEIILKDIYEESCAGTTFIVNLL